MTCLYFARNPYVLILVGLIATGYGVHLIFRGIQGDTLLSGTTFSYLPRWIFILTGLLFQLPLIGAIWFLTTLGYIKTG